MTSFVTEFAMKKLTILLFVIFTVSSSYADEQRYTVPLEDSPSCGAKNARVTVIEFLDYQ
jgi:hypothetical protein